MKVVSERLGRASIEITLNTYTHVLPSMQERPAGTMERLLRAKQERAKLGSKPQAAPTQ